MPSDLKLAAAEERLAEIIWATAPVKSTELAKTAKRDFGWEKSTAYTLLKRLADKGVAKNVLKFKKSTRIAIITALVLAAGLAIGLAVNRAALVFDFDGVTKIAVRSGTTGNSVEITAGEDVRKIAGFFNGRRFTREKALDGTGWNVALMFYEGDKLIENITVLDESHIDVAAARYGCRDADIDTDYLESLIVSASADDRRPMLMVGGILYFDAGRRLPAGIDESAALGAVASSVDQSEAPSRDGQSNFGKIGAKYAYFENGLAVLINGEWMFFEKAGSPAAPDYTDSGHGFAWMPLSYLPADYGAHDNLEKAISDGVYVNVQGAEIYNQATVDFFYKDFFEGRVAFMRTIAYTVEGDPIITDYEHDGKAFTVVTDTTRDKFGSPEIFAETYRYLVPHDRSRPAGVPMQFCLSNDETIYEATPDGDGARLKDGLGRIPSPSDSVGTLFLNP
jgi:predicted transcriptional regulator